MEAAIAKARREIKPGQATLNVPIMRASPFVVQLEYKQAGTPPSIHVTSAEMIYIRSGTGTFTMGGTLLGTKPGGSATTMGGTIGGTGIEGGITRPISAGALLLVPAGTAHAFTTVARRLVAVTIKLPLAPAPSASPAR